MPFAAAIAFAAVAMVWALRDGKAEASTGRLVLAWVAGVAALHSAAAITLWAASTDWDDPDAPSRLGSLGEPIVAAAAMGLSVAYALWLRRSAVVYLAFIALPFLAWYWLPAFR